MNPNKDVYLERCCCDTLKKAAALLNVIIGSVCLRDRRVLRSKDDSRATDFTSNIHSCVKML